MACHGADRKLSEVRVRVTDDQSVSKSMVDHVHKVRTAIMHIQV